MHDFDGRNVLVAVCGLGAKNVNEDAAGRWETLVGKQLYLS